MGAYTHGPWMVGRNDGFSVPINAGHELAFDLATVNHGGNDAEALANAKLIAAAPEMLDTLRHLLAAHNVVNRNGILPDLPAALAEATALVDRLEGA